MKKVILQGLIFAVVMAAIPAGAMVYSPQGQALTTLAAYEDTLLDRVIAATKVGVTSSTTGKRATGWGIARFTGSALAPMLTISIAAGGILWEPVIEPWLTENGWWYDNGVIRGHGDNEYVASPGAPGAGKYVGQTDGQGGTCYAHLYPTQADAIAAYDAYGGTSLSINMFNDCGPYGLCWSDVYWGHTAKVRRTGSSGSYQYHHFGWPKNGASVELKQEEKSAATVEDEFETDFAVDGSLARSLGVEVVTWAGQQLEVANRNWPGTVPAAVPGLSESQQDALQTAVNNAIDTQVKDELQDAADQNGTSPAPGSSGTASDWEYTPEQMAAAQNVKDLEREAAWLTDWEADKPADGNETGVTAGEYTLPERKDLTGVLDTFQGSLASLPIISWASGVELEVSGASSIINLPLPAAWGSSITVDFADYEDILDMMGAGLYALVGMASVLFLFRGRGD